MVSGLTSRERQVLLLTSQGLTTRQIALRLEISQETVKSHKSNLMRKLGARSMVQAVTMYLTETQPGDALKIISLEVLKDHFQQLIELLEAESSNGLVEHLKRVIKD